MRRLLFVAVLVGGAVVLGTSQTAKADWGCGPYYDGGYYGGYGAYGGPVPRAYVYRYGYVRPRVYVGGGYWGPRRYYGRRGWYGYRGPYRRGGYVGVYW